MFWLVLAIVLDFGFLQLFKLGQRRRHAAPVVIAVNYLTLALGLLLYLVIKQASFPPPAAVVLGVASGAAFVLSLLVMNHALSVAPVGAVLTAFRMAIVVPLALGLWLWGEALSASQLVGLLLILGALVLMSGGTGQGASRSNKRTFGLLALVFALQGISFTAMRYVHYADLDRHFLPIIVIAGLTAGLLGFGYVVYREVRITRSDVVFGAGIGLYNTISMPVVMLALSNLPGTTYFPLSGCSVVLLDNLCAHYVWGEKLTRTAISGLIMAILALALIIG